MTYLLLSILFSSLIFVVFRWIGIRQMDTFKVIVVNYFTAAVFGYVFLFPGFDWCDVLFSKWFTWAMVLGTTFIFVFYLMAITTQKNGTSIAVIANKMSLILPVIFAFLIYRDDISLIKVSGIVIAVVGVYLSLVKASGSLAHHFKLPLLLFICSGAIDICIKHVQHTSLSGEAAMLFVPTIFLFAFLMGIMVLIIKPGRSGTSWNPQVFLNGIVLGVINFFSIYFLVKALDVKTLQSSVIFPLNNISIVLLSTFFGLTLFREKLNFRNKVGILLSVIAIIMISLAR